MLENKNNSLWLDFPVNSITKRLKSSISMKNIIESMIDTLNFYQIYIPQVDDPELKKLLNSQYEFLTKKYKEIILYLKNNRDINKEYRYVLKCYIPEKKPILYEQEKLLFVPGVRDEWIIKKTLNFLKSDVQRFFNNSLVTENVKAKNILVSLFPNYLAFAYEISLYNHMCLNYDNKNEYRVDDKNINLIVKIDERTVREKTLSTAK